MQYIPPIYYKRVSCNTVPELPGLPYGGLNMNVVIRNLLYLSNEHRIVIYKPWKYKCWVWRNFQKAVRTIIQNKYNCIWYDANCIHVKPFGGFPISENDHISQGSVVCTWSVNTRYCTAQFNKNVQMHQAKVLKKEWFVENKLKVHSFGGLPLLESDYPKADFVICTKPVKVRYCTAQFNKNVQIHRSKKLEKAAWFFTNKLKVLSFGELPLLDVDYPKSYYVICTKPVDV